MGNTSSRVKRSLSASSCLAGELQLRNWLGRRGPGLGVIQESFCPILKTSLSCSLQQPMYAMCYMFSTSHDIAALLCYGSRFLISYNQLPDLRTSRESIRYLLIQQSFTSSQPSPSPDMALSKTRRPRPTQSRVQTCSLDRRQYPKKSGRILAKTQIRLTSCCSIIEPRQAMKVLRQSS